MLSEEMPLSEIEMRPRPTNKLDQEPTSAPDLEMLGEADTIQADLAALERASEQVGDKEWNSATEEEWSEHSATAWTLAHVIHHIRSTPLPPFLSPEQRNHFHKIIQMAAEMIEDWQRGERDQAQQLASARPVTELPAEPAEPIQQLSPEWPVGEGQTAQKPGFSYPPTGTDATGASNNQHQPDASDQNYEI
jgi:hypothetical protein